MTAAGGPRARREQVLGELRGSAEPLSIPDLAQRLGVHLNTVRFHVERLLEAGLIEPATGPRPATGRPPAYYRASRRMDPGGPRRYQLLSEVLLTALGAVPEPGERAHEAGREWGHRLATDEADQPAEVSDAVGMAEGTDRLVGLLDRLGFAPEPHAGAIALRHCPFLEMAQGRRDVICPVHLGIMEGALEAWGSEATATRLDPFLEPDLCLAHLGTRGGSR